MSAPQANSLSELARALEQLPDPVPSKDHWESIRTQIAPSGGTQSRRRVSLTLAAAAMLCIALLGLHSWQNHVEKQTTLTAWSAFNDQLTEDLNLLRNQTHVMRGHRAYVIAALEDDLDRINHLLSAQDADLLKGADPMGLHQQKSLLLTNLISLHAEQRYLPPSAQPQPALTVHQTSSLDDARTL